MPLTATTLTLPWDKEQTRPVGSHNALERMFKVACQGLTLTPEQLRQELEAGGDISDLVLRRTNTTGTQANRKNIDSDALSKSARTTNHRHYSARGARCL